jgi:hypothetical protein
MLRELVRWAAHRANVSASTGVPVTLRHPRKIFCEYNAYADLVTTEAWKDLPHLWTTQVNAALIFSVFV